MLIKTPEEILKMRKSGEIAAVILNKAIKFMKPGIKTIDIENYISNLLDKYKVKSAFKNYNDYPYNSCISVNEEIVHGLPGKRIVKEGDLVSIDFGVIFEGYCSDLAKTVPIGNITKYAKKLIDITEKSLSETLELIKPGVRLGTIQHNISKIILSNDLGLVKDLTGHGIGKNLQEEPAIPNFGQIGKGIILKPGMTFCLEPMVNLGDGNISVKDDGWTIISRDLTLAAHFEHTILVTQSGYEILTQEAC